MQTGLRVPKAKTAMMEGGSVLTEEKDDHRRLSSESYLENPNRWSEQEQYVNWFERGVVTKPYD